MGATRDRPAPEQGAEAREREREREEGRGGGSVPRFIALTSASFSTRCSWPVCQAPPLRFLLRAAVKKKRVVGTGGGKKASSDERVKARATFRDEEKG